jgi:Ca2+-transporting ATPase
MGDATVTTPTATEALAWPEQPWALEAEAVARVLATDPARGLSSAEAAARLSTVGPNELVEAGRRSAWLLFAEQFTNTMILVLAAAAVVTMLIGDRKDTVVIGAIVVLNGVVGFVQEYRAERAMAALRRLAAEEAYVVRDGERRRVAASDLVPGDLVILGCGDVVPADLRLVDAQALRVDEAALTGESEPVAKSTETLEAVDGSLVGERTNMAFKGTAVTYGRGAGVVVATGMATELGRIAGLLQAHRAAPTPLQQRLASLGRWMAAAALVVCAVVFTAGVARGEPVDRMFLTAVSLAVAAIPEGLPAVVTVALALGARRMAERHALVRKLPAVETLGSVTVICSDKTGTLTENRMVAERVWTPAGEYVVTGDGYEPAGELLGEGDPAADPFLAALARVAAACNDAVLHAPERDGEPWRLTGDPTEGALLALAGKRGVNRDAIERQWPRRAEVAFDASRRRMSTIHQDGEGDWVAVKGSFEALAPLLRGTEPADVVAARAAAERWAAQGFRVLALAERHTPRIPDAALTELEADLGLVGVVGITDPPRPEVRQAIADCRAAGVMPVMITGDHVLTATAIAERLGIPAPAGATLTGTELDALNDTDYADRVSGIAVYARTNPEQKLRIVNAWKRRGAVVAMTGDGVNDAPALRRADIGVAMGVIGTDVSKEAADMVLADDNFATIVHAVEEGRRIHDNIRRFVRYLLTTNSGEIWVMFLAPLLGLPVPLLPVQILWINLVTDGLPAIALGLEPAEPDTMRRPPRPPEESIFARGLWQHAVWVGLLMAAVVLPIQAGARAAGWHWPTMVFSTLALLQLGHALAVRSERRSFFALGARSNPWLLAAVGATLAVQLAIVYFPFLQDVFGTAALGAVEFAVVTIASTTVFVAVEIEKWFHRRRPSGVGGK